MGTACHVEPGFRFILKRESDNTFERVYDLSLQIPNLDSWQRTHNTFSSFVCNPKRESAYLSYERTVFNLNLRSCELRSVFSAEYLLDEVKTITVSESGTYVAVATIHEVVVLDSQSSLIVFRMGCKGAIAAISPDEKLIALAGEQSIHIFELPSGELLYKKKRIPVHLCCFDYSGDYLLYSTDNNEVFKWKYISSETNILWQGEGHINQLSMKSKMLEISFDCGDSKYLPI